MKHLVFYDGNCGLCDYVVQFLLQHDKKGKFVFAPLQGETADQLLEGISREDSLVLIENYKTSQKKTYLFGQAALRILWLLGGGWKILGWLNFLPPFLYNWAYSLVAKNRYRLFGYACILPDQKYKERFLK